MQNTLFLEKLKTFEEEEDIRYQRGIAILIDNTKISDYIYKLKSIVIPDHLKRVKRFDSYKSFFLISVSNYYLDIDANNQPEFIRMSLNDAEQGKQFYYESKHYLDVFQLRDEVFYRVYVPSRRFRNVEEWDKYGGIWPSIYHKQIDASNFEGVCSFIHLLHPVGFDICSEMCVIADKEVYAIEYDTDNVLGHAIIQAITKVSTSQVGYLCTGFDIYLYKEPCLSCAMALVHGRASKVFIVKSDKNGPFTKAKFCYNKSLNHRFPVYFMKTNNGNGLTCHLHNYGGSKY